jgi:multimeric flavodoxin WrbA
MEALVICGSGSRNGFTGEMCTSVSDGMRSAGTDVTVIHLSDLHLEHCTGCESCAVSGRCVIRDDMDRIYSMLEKVDIMVVATPICFSGPSSIAKTAIDRFQPYWFHKNPHPVRMVAMMCGGSAKPNFNNTLSILKALAITTGMEWGGQFSITNTDSKRVEEVSDPAYRFGIEVVRAAEAQKSMSTMLPPNPSDLV